MFAGVEKVVYRLYTYCIYTYIQIKDVQENKI